jgi:hypothetical protein
MSSWSFLDNYGEAKKQQRQLKQNQQQQWYNQQNQNQNQQPYNQQQELIKFQQWWNSKPVSNPFDKPVPMEIDLVFKGYVR